MRPLAGQTVFRFIQSKPAPKMPRQRRVRTEEEIAKERRKQEQREKRRKLKFEQLAEGALEGWGKSIIALRSQFSMFINGRHGQVVGKDVNHAIASVIKHDGPRGDVALFQGGQLVAVIVFEDDSPVVVYRDDLTPRPADMEVNAS